MALLMSSTVVNIEPLLDEYRIIFARFAWDYTL